MTTRARTFGLVVACATHLSCGGPGDYARNYEAEGAICIFSDAVIGEARHESPNGWATKPYDPQYWKEYWDGVLWFNVVSPSPPHPNYVGPPKEAIVQWVLLERRARNLPDLGTLPKSGDVTKRLYANLEDGAARVNTFISHRGIKCLELPPAA